MDCEFVGWCALTASEQAAWLQALGSLGAIFVVIGTAAYQRWTAKIDQRERDRLESNARYTRANRAIGRLRKVIARQIERARKQASGTVMGTFPQMEIPDALLDLEHDCHLMPDVGGQCLTAIQFFEGAQALLADNILKMNDVEKFISDLSYADRQAEIAENRLYKHLEKAKP